MIMIEIKNAMQLARQRSFLARAFGALVPETVARQVDEEVARLIREALAEHGVEVEIELR